MKLALIVPHTNTDYDVQLRRVKEHLPEGTLFIAAQELTLELIEREHVTTLIASDLSKEWCCMLRGMGVVTVVFGCRDFYQQIVDIVIDYKCEGSDHYLTGQSVDFNSEDPASFVEIATLVKKLDWDSEFFGVNVAYVSCLHLSENIYDVISRYAAENSIELTEYLCNCHDRRSVQIAEKYGFAFVDIRMTFIKELNNIKPVTCSNHLLFRKAVEEDISKLEAMVGQIYTKSRYYFDEKFGVQKARDFYKSWIRKAVRGEFDDECWCLTEDEQIVAFCSIRYAANKTVHIGLVGVNEAFVGKGIGKQMLERVIGMLAEKGIARIIVVTQGRNYAAQNLYQGVGFKTKETQLWYHKWR